MQVKEWPLGDRVQWLTKHAIARRVEESERSLRAIAAEFGVSHDSVWRVALARRLQFANGGRACDDFRSCRPVKCPACSQRITRIPCLACVLTGRLVDTAEAVSIVTRSRSISRQQATRELIERAKHDERFALWLRGNVCFFVREGL